MFIASLFTDAQTQKQPRCSSAGHSLEYWTMMKERKNKKGAKDGRRRKGGREGGRKGGR
jgi:hypothetical protein